MQIDDKGEELVQLIHAWMHRHLDDCLPFVIFLVEEPTLHVFGNNLSEADVRYCIQKYLVALEGRVGDQPPVH